MVPLDEFRPADDARRSPRHRALWDSSQTPAGRLCQAEEFSRFRRTTSRSNPTNPARRQLSARQAASDDVLIARIAQGDRLAMQVLYGRHHVRVFRFGLRPVRDEQVAEDLIGEVFLDVRRQAGKFEGRSAVSTWLLAITRFKAPSALRRRKDIGIPWNTVKTRVFYARKKLAELLQAAGVERGWP